MSWGEEQMKDPEMRRLVAREWFTELYLDQLDAAMKRHGVSRSELARRMKCNASNVTQLMSRARNLTIASMVDMAFFIGYEVVVSLRLAAGATIAQRIEQLHGRFDDKVSDLAKEIRAEHIIPFCDEHGLYFASGQGTFWFGDLGESPERDFIGTIEEAREHGLEMESVFALLDLEVHRTSSLGEYVEGYEPESGR